MKTNIYHIGYTQAIKEVSIFFWGCNFKCKGCLCHKEIRNYLLKENLHLFNEEPKGIAPFPDKFLDVDEVAQALEGLDFNRVLLEGQEASLDPAYPLLTETLHKKFGSRNILCTNAYKIPSLEHTDELQIGLKAFTDRVHRDYTGKSNKKVLDNFTSLYRSGRKLTVSSIFIPEYIDAEETERIAEFLASLDKNIPYHILAYFKAGDSPWRRPTHDEIDQAASLARKHLNRVWGWRGDEEVMHAMKRIF
ncbi:radical SAM protein [Dehalogenimonas sp. THU2]|uniref:radical SAM protein n=1 Tax=Dehalogenimonas sp. THU2 TaxID=3151121 RepID=UPI003218B1F3